MGLGSYWKYSKRMLTREIQEGYVIYQEERALQDEQLCIIKKYQGLAQQRHPTLSQINFNTKKLPSLEMVHKNLEFRL